MANLNQDGTGSRGNLTAAGTIGSSGMAGNLLEITITYQRKLRLETCRAMGSGKIARVVFVNRIHAILVAERGFEMLPLLAMGRSETIPEISILAETTKQSHKTSVSHLLWVPDRAFLV